MTSSAPAPSESVAREPRLDSLTSLRFFAAAFVVMGHTQWSDTYTSPVLHHVFAFPFAGVTFFFVLSGFVLVWSYRPDSTPRQFYIRRFARVWPLYALVTILLFPIGWFIRYPEWDFGDYLVVWFVVLIALQSLCPLSRVQEAVNPPNWSLSVEVFFYALFPALRPLVARCRPERLNWLAGGLMVLSSAIWIFEGDAPWAYFLSGGEKEPMRYIPALAHLPEFVLGMVLARQLRDRKRSVIPPVACVSAVVVWTLVLGWLHWASVPWFPMSLSAFAVLTAVPLSYFTIRAFVSHEIAGRQTVLQRRWMVRLGDWSYALYLINLTVIHLAFRALGPEAFGGNDALASVVLLALSIVVAAALHRGFERPVQRLILRRFARRAAPPTKRTGKGEATA